MAFIGIFAVLIFGVIVALMIQYIIPLIILGFVSTLGAVLFITALVRRNRAEKQGLPPKKAMMITGIVLTLAPPVIITGWLIWKLGPG